MPRTLLATLAAALLGTAPSLADDGSAITVSSSGPAALQHHRGVFLRPDLGFGYVSANASPGGTDLSIAGPAASLGIAAGGAIARNQILAIHFWDFVASNPNVTTGGLRSASANSVFALFALGPEYTFYSNSNYYLSASPALTRINYLSHGSASSSNFGYGLRASFGKEWWASESWGLGVAAQVSVSVNQDSGTNAPTWTSWGATVAFSATYN